MRAASSGPATASIILSQRHEPRDVEEENMARCEVCGNDYHMSFEVITAGVRHVFDSFECAIQKLAPECEVCGCRIVGHGLEADGTYYCCDHCARKAGVEVLRDRA
jgi:hypothetical protein